MVSRKDLSWQRKRITSLLATLARNRSALIGLVLLFGFVFMALGAPLLTPYTPDTQVSGSLAQPDWVMNFPDGYYLSRNIVVVPDTVVTSPAAVQEWSVSGTPQMLSSLQVSYSTVPGPTGAVGGSLQAAYSGTTSDSASITRNFQFPYRGAPRNFKVDLSVVATGVSASQPVNIQVFIQKVGGRPWTILDQNFTDTGKWSSFTPADLDSGGQTIKTLVLGSSSDFTASEVIFSSAGTYSYGLRATFSGPATINIQSLQLSLLGTAYGLMGTDNGGRDVYTQFVYGSRISLLVGLLAASIGISVGLVVGLLAGFLGKLVDEVLMRFTDMLLVIPTLPLLIVLVAVLGANIWNLIIIIGFLGWMGFARIIRSQVLSLRERPFIEAAKAAGAGAGRIITRHIFPNIVSLTYVNLALTVPGAILGESALAFLGLSDPQANSWGHMFENVNTAGAISLKPPPWWWVLPPGFGIMLISLSFVLIGYALDEIFNPRLRRRQ
jgi:peptide/nickel transport system permease protein